MIDRTGKYEVGFFAQGTHVEPNPDIIIRLLETFKDRGFLPITVDEVLIGSSSKMRRQLQLTDNNSVWNLAFEPHRILLTKSEVKGLDIGTPDNFIGEAVDIIGRILHVIPLKGSRLSYITKGLLKEMTDVELKKVNSNLLKLPAFYIDDPPHQWVIKNVNRKEFHLHKKLEQVNIITEISRIQGLFNNDPPIPFDRIAVGFDINTYQKNKDPRFGIEDIVNFLRIAVDVSKQITTEEEKIIYG